MKESTLIYLSFLVGMIGIATLVIAEEIVPTAALSPDKTKGVIQVEGVIKTTRTSGDTVFFEVQTKEKVYPVVLFKGKKAKLKKGMKVRVEGSLTTYKGSTELIGRRVEQIV